jgi:hypothetical protein
VCAWGAFRSGLDGFQPRERIDDERASWRTGGSGAVAATRGRKRRTGTVVKTVPVGVVARIVVG